MESLKVTLFQSQITWHELQTNLEHFDEQIHQISDTDLIVLPEMWVSGFSMLAHRYYDSQVDALALMQKWSLDKQACVVGSLITKVGEKYFNRLYVVQEGEVSCTYDKKHLFAFAGEDRVFTAGSEHVSFKLKEWTINPLICYDLRFPVWVRNRSGYDILIFSANWPDKRINAWRTLLKARAIENQAYVLGVNCFGIDAWKNKYSGHSAIIGYDGEIIETIYDKEGFISAELDLTALKKFREDLPFLKDQDNFQLL